MAIGKREQLVGLIVGVLVLIFLLHLLIFDSKAKEYDTKKRAFDEGAAALQNAQIVPSERWFKDQAAKTKVYADQVTSIATELNLEDPAYFASSYKDRGFLQDALKRYDDFKRLVTTLTDLRRTMKQPQLTFLDNRPDRADPYKQLGWNLTSALPGINPDRPDRAARARLWDNVKKLDETADSYVTDPEQRLQSRFEYNRYLPTVGLNPWEISDYYAVDQRGQPIFFQDLALKKAIARAEVNKRSLTRLGFFLPDIKKRWTAELLDRNRIESATVSTTRVVALLEVEKFPIDDKLLFINRQLQAVIDVAKLGEQAKLEEISSIAMLRPTDLVKHEKRIPGKPAPSPTAAPTAGPGGRAAAEGAAGAEGSPPAGETVGQGSGLEINVRGTNTATMDFLFLLGTAPRAFALDDIDIRVGEKNQLLTTATLEIVTRLPKGKGGASTSSAPAAPAAPAPPPAPGNPNF